jgi:two-component system sensor histidine kinase KdpD
MDLDAILVHRPGICVVDELPHTNIPGLRHEKRWQDVLDLLAAGIDVYTTMNIQHLESLNDQVWQISGVRVRETIPDWLMTRADEVVMVDLTPRALLNRLARGVVYQPDKAKQAIKHFFKESTLVALREVALRQTAHEVEVRHGTGDSHESILILVTDDPSTAMLIRRGKRVADYLQASCFAVYIHREVEFLDVPLPRRQAIERHLNFARNLHVETRTLQGDDLATSLIEFARLHDITQIFIARPKYEGLQRFPGGNLIHKVVRLAREMQVTVVAQRTRHA